MVFHGELIDLELAENIPFVKSLSYVQKQRYPSIILSPSKSKGSLSSSFVVEFLKVADLVPAYSPKFVNTIF